MYAEARIPILSWDSSCSVVQYPPKGAKLSSALWIRLINSIASTFAASCLVSQVSGSHFLIAKSSSHIYYGKVQRAIPPYLLTEDHQLLSFHYLLQHLLPDPMEANPTWCPEFYVFCVWRSLMNPKQILLLPREKMERPSVRCILSAKHFR